ncbi:MAG: type II toxin-antitoxin system Phd/YefM family antitoxin [Thermoanaerobaculia bacterium]|nr:type II toxin-antitoxin system Phd/YefM family antitoxin [Thermoanaerobaculia bacterium]
MSLSATALRSRLYEVLDEVLRTGQPVEIERKGKKLLIVAAPAGGTVDSLAKRPGYVVGDPDDLVHMDWTDQWKP